MLSQKIYAGTGNVSSAAASAASGGSREGGHRGLIPPFRLSNYIFIVAQYSVLNCVQASADVHTADNKGGK